MSVKKVTTEITYRVPMGSYCNLSDKTKDKCRFCVKDRSGYRCALYNEPLNTTETVYVLKARDCTRALCGYKSVVEDVQEQEFTSIVDPKLIMRTTLDEYTRVRNKLMSQGYPVSIVDKIAREYVLGGN